MTIFKVAAGAEVQYKQQDYVDVCPLVRLDEASPDLQYIVLCLMRLVINLYF